MNRLAHLLACVLCAVGGITAFAANPDLEMLDPSDRAIVRKLLVIDPKLKWSGDQRVISVGFSPKGATTAALALLPQLLAFYELALPEEDNASVPGWQLGDMAPLSRCPRLRVLRIAIAAHHTPETWKSLPVLHHVTELKIFDQAAGRVIISDRCPQAERIILWTDGQEQFDSGQFRKHNKLTQLYLHLGKSSWNGEGLSRLANCPSLEELLLQGEGLTDVALREIGTVKSLKSLILSSGKFTPEGFEALTDLESFRCPEPWFNDELAMGLKNSHKLKRLDVMNTEVHGSCFTVLATLPLEVIKASKIRLEDLHLLKDCKTLKSLRLEAKTKTEIQLQDRIWEAIGQKAGLSRTWTGAKGDDPQ
jgi:hypothetical protein